MSKTLILYIGIALLLPNNILAENKKLLIPRFASIKSNEVNARTGPSTKCPLEWIFTKKGEPIEIVAEYEQWRQIKDIEGEGGWVHSSVLSGKRSVVIKSRNIIELLKYYTSNKAEVVARVSPGVRCQIKKCVQEFCLLLCKGNKGWAPKTALWGIYTNE